MSLNSTKTLSASDTMPGSPVRRYTEEAPAKALPLWKYKGALTHVQSIPDEDRKTLFQHKLTTSGPHPLEDNDED